MRESFPTCYEQFIEYGRQQGRQEGRLEGRLEGILEGIREAEQEVFFELLFQLVEDGDLSLEKAAKKAGLTVNEFLEKKKEYHSDSEWCN